MVDRALEVSRREVDAGIELAEERVRRFGDALELRAAREIQHDAFVGELQIGTEQVRKLCLQSKRLAVGAEEVLRRSRDDAGRRVLEISVWFVDQAGRAEVEQAL